MQKILNLQKRGFTTIELLVAITVTAILAGLLLSISTSVLNTQKQSSSSLESNQIAQFVLDRIQEDLQCALFRNDGNAWLAISILTDKENSGNWNNEPQEDLVKPSDSQYSLRIIESDWSDENSLQFDPFSGQGPLSDSRFGVAGTWLRFFSQSPETDPSSTNLGAARAIAYQIIRHGVTNSPKSIPRYQLFRTDVTAKDTFEAGYDLGPDGGYAQNASNTPRTENQFRIPTAIKSPVFDGDQSFADATIFSLASNIIDFGVRAYVTEKKSDGSGNFKQIFPIISSKSLQSFDFYSIRNPTASNEGPFPDFLDVMIRVLTKEGAKVISNYELGITPNTSGLSHEEYWWKLAEENSDVFIRRIKIFGSGL